MVPSLHLYWSQLLIDLIISFLVLLFFQISTFIFTLSSIILLLIDVPGWIFVGSLDGFLYSCSPTGILKKFSKADILNFVIQIAPLLDCSGFAIYFSQTEMEGKISQTIYDYTCASAMRPKIVIFSLLVPATGSLYWSESYPSNQFLVIFHCLKLSPAKYNVLYILQVYTRIGCNNDEFGEYGFIK